MWHKTNRIYFKPPVESEASIGHDPLDSAQVADTHKMRPFLQPATAG